MDRLRACVIGPLRRAQRQALRALAAGAARPSAVGCEPAAHAAVRHLRATIDVLHANLESERPGSTRTAGAALDDWHDALLDLVTGAQRCAPWPAEELAQRIGRLSLGLGLELDSQLRQFAPQLSAGARSDIVHLLRRRRGTTDP